MLQSILDHWYDGCEESAAIDAAVAEYLFGKAVEKTKFKYAVDGSFNPASYKEGDHLITVPPYSTTAGGMHAILEKLRDDPNVTAISMVWSQLRWSVGITRVWRDEKALSSPFENGEPYKGAYSATSLPRALARAAVYAYAIKYIKVEPTQKAEEKPASSGTSYTNAWNDTWSAVDSAWQRINSPRQGRTRSRE